jgi:hypothetical protein
MTGPVIARIGEIRVTSSTVWTPAGEFPLRGSEWTVTDQWVTEQRTPPWAVVLAIGGLCVVAFFSLLFLLVRRSVSRGMVLVSVRNGPHRYSTRIPVADQAQAQAVYHQVDYARSLATL